MTTLYVAGPMSGIAEFNHPAFCEASARLRSAGYTVVNPAESASWEAPASRRAVYGPEFHAELPGEIPWCEYLRRDLIELLTHAEGVALLPGYQTSLGASVEIETATTVRIPVKQVERWLEDAEQ